MKIYLNLLAVLSFCLLSHLAPAQSIPENPELKYFESKIKSSPLVNKTTSSVAARTHLLKHQQAKSGLKVLASVGLSRNDEPVNDFSRRSYDQIFVKGGLTYPILGSYQQEQDKINNADIAAEVEKSRLKLHKELVLRQIRRNYIDYWSSSEQIKLAMSFLETESTMTQILEQRTKADILFESDRMEFMTAFSLVKRDLSNLIAKQQHALFQLNALCGTAYIEFTPKTPELLDVPNSLNAIIHGIFTHPELEIEEILTDKHLLKTGTFYSRSVEASLNLFQSYSEDDPGGHGSSSLASMTIKMPVREKQAHREMKKYHLAEFKKFFFSRQNVFANLYTRAALLFYEYSARKTNIRFAARRLNAAKHAMRETYLRANVLEGDVIEKLHQRRYAYYRVAFDTAQARNMLAKSCAELLFLTGACKSKQNLALSTPQTQPEILGMKLLANLTDKKTQKQLVEKIDAIFNQIPTANAPQNKLNKSTLKNPGAYFWRTEKLLNKRYIFHEDPDVLNCLPIWKHCKKQEINTLLMSLNGSQIEHLHRSPRKHAMMRRFLNTARSKNISVALLLGDASWIKHPAGLMQIIQKLKSLPFSGLHLDMEPSQLKHSPEQLPQILEHFANTLWQVSRISPWPISISMHPRLITKALPDGTLFGSKLEQLQLDYISLMIYVSDETKSTARFKKIASQFPTLNFALACSVEPLKILPSKNSFFTFGKTHFKNTVDKINTTLLNTPNFCGLLIQDWTSLEDMNNEN